MLARISILVSFLCLVLGGCLDGGENQSLTDPSQNQGDDLDPGLANQAPAIACKITNNDTGDERIINTIRSLNESFQENPVVGQTVTFDCSSTHDGENETNDLRMFIDAGYDPNNPVWTPIDRLSYYIRLDSVADQAMAIRALDDKGAESILNFAMVTLCQDEMQPLMADPDAQIQVSSSGPISFFDFEVIGTIEGGNEFRYSWDFNGDGIYDPYKMNSDDTWTKGRAVTDKYSVFHSLAPLRTIGLKIRNECNRETQYLVTKTMDITNIERIPESRAVVQPYYYLQADVSHEEIPGARRVNGDFIVTHQNDSYRRIQCEYTHSSDNKAKFKMLAYNWYRGDRRIHNSNETLHGMQFLVTGINDNGGTALQRSTGAEGAEVNEVRYLASSAGDGVLSLDYNQIKQACDIDIRVERANAVKPCDNGSDVQSETITILGELNCDRVGLSSDSSDEVALNNGKFYCEVSKSDRCAGGGGGGGGNPPVPQ